MNYTYKSHLLLPIHKLKIKWLRHRGHKLSKWEHSFLKDIKHKQKLTLKQFNKINEIYTQVRKDVPRYIGCEHYKPEYDVSEYAEIHNFDK